MKQLVQQRCWRGLCGLCVWVACQAGAGTALFGQEPGLADAAEPPRAAADEFSPEEKRRRAMAGLFAVAGIAIAGVGLGVLVLVWGARLRRLSRQPLPTCELQNEHWFLKPPKPPVSPTGPETQPTDEPG